MEKIKVIIVDDSVLIRQLFTELLESDPAIEVVATAIDPYDAREKIKQHNPDVITLDIEMPKMDGIAFLEKIMSLRPMPVVMLSSLTQNGADATLRALELGAVDYVAKPVGSIDDKNALAQVKDELIGKIKMASIAKIQPLKKPAPHSDNDRIIRVDQSKIDRSKIIAIGSSTGGVEALREVLVRMPDCMPPIIIVQHMPPKFTESFARRLDGLCQPGVHEVTDGMRIAPGNVYIAQGDRHFSIEKKNGGYFCLVKEGENVSGHRPSVDVLFESVAKVVGKNSIGVILTGMGRDGASGMLAMKKSGSYTIGQDEATCVVYGMPKEAKTIGALDIQLPLVKIAEEIINKSMK